MDTLISLSLKGGFLLDIRVIALSIALSILDKNVLITSIMTETAIILIIMSKDVGIIYIFVYVKLLFIHIKRVWLKNQFLYLYLYCHKYIVCILK